MIEDALWLSLAATLAFAGCAALSLSQPKHWRNVTGNWDAPRIAAPIGWALVLAALIPCVARDGGSFAALLWPMILAPAALAVATLLALRPAWLRRLALGRSFDRRAGQAPGAEVVKPRP